jgi:RNA polymerase sigma-70 factor (ECF subfamily)
MAEIPPTRASLLVRLRDPGDETAWRDFVDLYTPVVYGYARKQGLQAADAADLSQEVLGAVLTSVKRLDYDPRRGAFRNWLFTIVRRKLANWRAASGKQCGGSGDTATHQLLDQAPGDNRLETLWQAEWEQHLVGWACEQIRRDVTPTTWQAFWRSAIEGRPGKQVAVDLGLSIAAVYHARSRVLARLKDLVRSVEEP